MKNHTTTTNPVSALSSLATMPNDADSEFEIQLTGNNDLSKLALGSSAILNMFMSSREIASFCDKEHRNVKRDIERMLGNLDIDMLKFEHTYTDSFNRKQTEYRLPINLAINLVSGYSDELRFKIINRWLELENERHLAILEELAETQDQVTRLTVKLAQSTEYATIKRMSLNYHGQKFDWRKLKKASKELGIDPIDVYDSNYGTVKAYHMDVWRKAYALEIPYVSPDHDIDQDDEDIIQDEL